MTDIFCHHSYTKRVAFHSFPRGSILQLVEQLYAHGWWFVLTLSFPTAVCPRRPITDGGLSANTVYQTLPPSGPGVLQPLRLWGAGPPWWLSTRKPRPSQARLGFRIQIQKHDFAVQLIANPVIDKPFVSLMFYIIKIVKIVVCCWMELDFSLFHLLFK